MAYFLAKTDPETYSIQDLERDKKTVWDGIHSYQAIGVIKRMKIGDYILIYHSMGNAGIVGVAKVISMPRDAEEKRASWVVDVEYIDTFKEALTLKTIKESHLFDDWALIRQGRLSTMTVPDEFISWMKNLKFNLPNNA